MKNRRRKVPTIRYAVIILVCVAAVAAALRLSGFELPAIGPAASLDHGWDLVLVNAEYSLPKNWDGELTELSNGERVDARIYPELQRMFDDMRAQGAYPVVASGYRSREEQQDEMDGKIAELNTQGFTPSEAEEEALKWVAAVGHSEHQTGLAVDINADGVNSTGEEVYDWLAANAWQYGFILRYPAGKTEITGTAYEPWHYRYVGQDAAQDIHQRGLCLEEYWEELKAA